MSKDKTRLLIDARVLEGEAQGSATYLRELYRAFMDAYGKQYELFFAAENEQAIRDQFPEQYRFGFIPLHTGSRTRLYGQVFPKLIKEWKIDWAHFQYMVPFFKKCGHIVTTHDVLFLDFPQQFPWTYRTSRRVLFKLAFWNSDIKVTVSDYSKRAISQHFGVRGEEIVVTPNAVRAQYFEEHDKGEIRQELEAQHGIKDFVLFVSRLEQRKNHRLLLEAFEKLKLYEDYQLVFVGNNSLDDEDLQGLVEESLRKYPGRFHWFRQVEEGLLMQLYRGAKAFVYPSLAEGFGIPPLEAAACLVPTLCASNTAMTDFTFFGENLFDAGQPEQFLQKLQNVLQSPPDQQKLIDIAEQIKQKYSWRYAAQVIHESITGQKSSPHQKKAQLAKL
ncbi:MAG: glycosyltransferase family 4 protein [Saprospiraceae bacterium]|nr:glycosyltransferase family 4 protein [Saprospiraceae bacterium]